MIINILIILLILLWIIFINGFITLKKIDNFHSKLNNNIKVISCNCKVLSSPGHMNHITHKILCPIFRKLNPHISYEQFMRSEGFPGTIDCTWPIINVLSNS